MDPSESPSPAEQNPFLRSFPELLLLAIIICFAGIEWVSVQHVNTLWDEANDSQVAVSLLREPLVGSPLDATQARLPMYVTAAAYAVAGPSIGVARAVSITMGAAAIALIFVTGRRWFGNTAGLFAAALLAFSPFFLTFSRAGLTEGDAFCPATVLLMLLAFDAYLGTRDSKHLVLFAIAFGLALSAKFYALFFVPPLMLWDLLDAYRNPATASAPSAAQHVEQKRILTWAAAGFGLQLLAAVFAQVSLRWPAALGWVIGLVVLLAGVLEWFFLASPDRLKTRRLIRWNTLSGWLIAMLLAAAVCGAVCPAHVLNPEVARSLVRSIIHPVEPELMLRFWDPARLYVGVLLIKLGLPLGVLTVVSLIWARAQQADTRPAMLSTTIALYVFFLLFLPLRQPFYLMSVYPLIILVLAWFVRYAWILLSKRELVASGWLALVATSSLYLLWGTISSYPEFGYYGYKTIGKNWLGAESRGYRNLIQVTNDGTEDAMSWLSANVPPGRRVVSYLWDDHVIDRFFADHPPKFQLVRRNAYLARWSPPEIEDADYVVFALNNETSYHDLPPEPVLHDRFDSSGGHVVWRGRGSAAMPVVQILARADRGLSAGTSSRPNSPPATAEAK